MLQADAQQRVDGVTHVTARLAVPGGSIDRVGLLGSSECPTCAGQGSDSPGADLLRGVRSAPATRPGGSRGTDVEALGLPVSALANPVCGVLGGAPIRSYRATASAPTSGRFLVRSKYGLHEMWWGGHTDTYAQSELVGILEGLDLSDIPRLIVYNKADLLSAEARAELPEGEDRILVSAATGEGTDSLVSRIGERLRESGKRYEAAFSASR